MVAATDEARDRSYLPSDFSLSPERRLARRGMLILWEAMARATRWSSLLLALLLARPSRFTHDSASLRVPPHCSKRRSRSCPRPERLHGAYWSSRGTATRNRRRPRAQNAARARPADDPWIGVPLRPVPGSGSAWRSRRTGARAVRPGLRIAIARSALGSRRSPRAATGTVSQSAERVARKRVAIR